MILVRITNFICHCPQGSGGYSPEMDGRGRAHMNRADTTWWILTVYEFYSVTHPSISGEPRLIRAE